MTIFFKRSYLLYTVVFLFLTLRLFVFERGMYGIPDGFIYMASLSLLIIDTFYYLIFFRHGKGISIGLIFSILSVLASIGILLSIYIFKGIETLTYWETGVWKW